jgi:hypothetical protein
MGTANNSLECETEMQLYNTLRLLFQNPELPDPDVVRVPVQRGQPQ